MLQTGIIPSAHSDLVTDAAYDFYGQRLATCSLDQRIKVWQFDKATGEWKVEDDWKAHEAAISKISWAHPEFGTIIASCSFDRTVKIWEQLAPGGQNDASAPQQQSQQQQQQQGGQHAAHASPRWIERAVLLDARGTVRSVEFAPHRLGLKLATISSDNFLRIYECLEQPSLSTWQITEEVDVSALPSSVSPSIHSRIHTMALATPTQTHATLDTASASLVAQALQQGLQQAGKLGGGGIGNREADGGWCISWCKEHYWGEVVATGCGTNGIVKIIHISPSRRPSIILALDPSPSSSSKTDGTTAGTANPSSSNQLHTSGDGDTHAGKENKDTGKEAPYAITSVAWAPSCGRSYHLIATGGRDGKVRIWKVKPSEETGGGDLDSYESVEDEMKWTATVVADFDQHKSSVGRVEWNITGTVLSSVGNDGRVRLWKATSGNVWRPAGSIGVEQSAEDDQENHGHSSRDVDMDS